MGYQRQQTMKRPHFLLASLGLNLGLALAIGWTAQRGRSLPSVTPTAPNSPRSVFIAASPEAPGAAPELTSAAPAPFHWSLVESTNYRDYMKNLRAIGCPEQRIRDIIVADVDELFAVRARDFAAPLQAQFWELAAKPQDLEKVFSKYGKALESLADEHEKLFQELFNDSNPRRHWRNTFEEQQRAAAKLVQLDFLDATKRAAVVALEGDLETALSSVREMKFTGTAEEIRRRRQSQEKETRAASEQQLRALLNADEFAEYQLRNSSGAHIRFQLARMTLSEGEAHSIAEVMADKAAAATTSGDELDRRTQDRIKQLLGEARYGEYQRASDGRFNQTARLIERLELPEQTAVTIYQTQVEAEKFAARLRADVSASAEERNAALALLRTEAENSVRGLLGGPAFKSYQDHAGSWFQGLSQPGK